MKSQPEPTIQRSADVINVIRRFPMLGLTVCGLTVASVQSVYG